MKRNRARIWATTIGTAVAIGLGGGSLGVATAAPPAPPAPTAAPTPAPVGATGAGRNASDEWPITECGTVSGRGCAPTERRVDLVRPTFSHPTDITNPLFPTKGLHVLQLGRVDGKPFRSETTTLPQTGVVDWYGQRIEVVLSQYVAFLDGRIEEIALDRYAQADDGSVWYFGEDVIDYVDGNAHLTEGTWLAGRDGPPAMLMPAHPKLGDVYRVENILGVVFEELTVKQVDQTVDGPNGPVRGAIVVDELGASGQHSQKTLAPGYGEFLTTNDSEIEAVAVATPVNAIPGGVPAAIRHIVTAATGAFEYGRGEAWPTAQSTVQRIARAVDQIDPGSQPPRIKARLRGSLKRLTTAVADKDVARTERWSVEVARAAVDLEARYLPPDTVEVERFHLLSQQMRVDAAREAAGDVQGDVAAMEWTLDRIAALTDAERAEVDVQMRALRAAADSRNLPAAADHAVRLAAELRNLTNT